MRFTEIDRTFEGTVPEGTDLIVVEKVDVDNGTFKSAMALYGFDEVGMFTETTMQYVYPVYGFLKIETKEENEMNALSVSIHNNELEVIPSNDNGFDFLYDEEFEYFDEDSNQELDVHWNIKLGDVIITNVNGMSGDEFYHDFTDTAVEIIDYINTEFF